MRHKKSKLIANFCCSYRCLSLILICFILFSAGENNKYALFKFVNAQYDPFQDFSSPQKPLKANTNNETGVNANAETTNDTKLNANANAEINPKTDQNSSMCSTCQPLGVNCMEVKIFSSVKCGR